MVTGESLQGRTAREELRSVHWAWDLRVPELWLRMDFLEVGNVCQSKGDRRLGGRKVETRSASSVSPLRGERKEFHLQRTMRPKSGYISQVEPALAGSLGSHQKCTDCEKDSRSLTRPGGHKRPDSMGMHKWDISSHRAPPWRSTCLAILFPLEPLSPLRYFNFLQSLLLHGISFLFI